MGRDRYTQYRKALRGDEESFADYVRRILSYDPETGIFTWGIRANGRVPVGSIAGSIDLEGYRRISIRGVQYKAHRLAFLFMTDSQIPDCVDHINGERDDNRWVNIRAATQTINSQNIRKAAAKNKTGFLGVSKDLTCNRYRASIRANGEGIYLGLFKTPEEAHQAYVDAKRRLHKGCTI